MNCFHRRRSLVAILGRAGPGWRMECNVGVTKQPVGQGESGMRVFGVHLLLLSRCVCFPSAFQLGVNKHTPKQPIFDLPCCNRLTGYRHCIYRPTSRDMKHT